MNVIAMEIEARKIVLRRLEQPIKLAKARADKVRADRAADVAAANEYESYLDLQEAYGVGDISAAEFDRLQDLMDAGEAYIAEKTAEDLAVEILLGFRAMISGDLRELEYQAMPMEEKRRVDAALEMRTRRNYEQNRHAD